jgi:ABC-type bacteriocin/lantibiotic exporter with double-glycine peptidase domain
MLYLSQAARQKGLYAQGVKWNWKRLRKWPNPAIAHWENHFVLVLGSTKDNQIKILDPPSDPLLMDANSFCEKWDGKVLLLSDKPINTFLISLSEHWLLIPAAILTFLMTLRFVHKYSHKKNGTS